MLNVLFIDDDPEAHLLLRIELPSDCHLSSASDGQTGIELARTRTHDLVLLDIGLPDISGMEVLHAIVAIPGGPPVVMLTVSTEPELIVRAMREGAYDYLVKPITRGNVESALRSAIRFRKSRGSPATEHVRILSEIVGDSVAIRNTCQLVATYASSNSTVLVIGESGTGKELIARAIHRLSPRGGFPFTAVNCGALPDALVESELFGAERGAYTDAVARPGLFEATNGGTLFLDEIGELSKHAQCRLLRVLESRELTRLGTTRSIPVDVRLVAATNSNLEEALGSKSFRRDLFYRINVLRLELPPLRDRREDVPLLVGHFLAGFHFDGRMSESALDALCEHGWPGNVRELRNVIERAVVLAGRGTIERRHVQFD